MPQISDSTWRVQRNGVPQFEAKPGDKWLQLLRDRVKVIGDCWIMDGKEHEYGLVFSRVDGQKAAHRLVYAWVHPDENIDEMHIHHLCEKPGCINPRHLAAMTPADHASLHAQRKRCA